MRRTSGSTRSNRFGLKVAAAIVLSLALTACPSGSPKKGPDGGAVKPVTGGEVVVAYPYEPTSLNPFVAGGDAPPTRDLVRPLMPALYKLGPKGARVPWLLASEPARADVGGTPFSVRLKLREDAVWSDGQPITASDLRFTWQAVMRSPAIASRDGYDRLTDIVVESAKIARLVFKEPFARWRDLFSAGLGVLPSHTLMKTDISNALGRAWPVSGGPYVLRAWTPGLEMIFERNPNAWGSKPLLDRIRVQFVSDPVTALQLFRARRVDVIAPNAGVDFKRRAGAALPGAKVSTDRGATWVGLFLDVRSGPLADLRVRRALAQAMDRPAIVEGLVRDEGAFLDTPSAGDPTRTTASFSRYAYAPNEAERVLDSAGWKSAGKSSSPRRKAGRALSFTVASVGNDELMARVLRAMNSQASAVGFDMNLVGLDSDVLWGSWLSGSRFDAAILIERDPPGGSFRARFGLSGPHNLSGLADAKLRALLDAADRTLDDASPAVDAPFARVADFVPVIPLFRLDATVATRPEVHEVAASAAADGFLWNVEKWWIDGGTEPGPAAS
jgi:peptide/nickel transport system substrate-binding protein